MRARVYKVQQSRCDRAELNPNHTILVLYKVHDNDFIGLEPIFCSSGIVVDEGYERGTFLFVGAARASRSLIFRRWGYVVYRGAY